MFIPDPGSAFFHPGSGIRIQGSKKHRIPDPDPQHWNFSHFLRQGLLENCNGLRFWRGDTDQIFIPFKKMASIYIKKFSDKLCDQARPQDPDMNLPNCLSR
jgi:hypothetical protein